MQVVYFCSLWAISVSTLRHWGSITERLTFLGVTFQGPWRQLSRSVPCIQAVPRGCRRRRMAVKRFCRDTSSQKLWSNNGSTVMAGNTDLQHFCNQHSNTGLHLHRTLQSTAGHFSGLCHQPEAGVLRRFLWQRLDMARPLGTFRSLRFIDSQLNTRNIISTNLT